ncbi:hypothetical protein ACIHFE_23870 [Streptomyces sp. NPDC052396]|uniref:hypothetical protein n=1 Tax=Streptomyces sp. NPDC052396 TaxID=3365689 RepID=UPI0037CE493F
MLVAEADDDDLAAYVGGVFATDKIRSRLLAAAAEPVYVAGWMSFDASDYEVARRYFTLAVTMAAEAGDAPLEGHVLRAMAHQATDLGHPKQGVSLALASFERKRYSLACPRERALLGVVQARSLAAAGQKRDAVTALLRAEDDLAAADAGLEEPARVWFFPEASLAHETARTLVWTEPVVVRRRASSGRWCRSSSPATRSTAIAATNADNARWNRATSECGQSFGPAGPGVESDASGR